MSNPSEWRLNCCSSSYSSIYGGTRNFAHKASAIETGWRQEMNLLDELLQQQLGHTDLFKHLAS